MDAKTMKTIAIAAGVVTIMFAGPVRAEDFRGRNCIDGCPDMKAGYKWAQEQDVRDPYQCLGRTRDFEQGCSAYALEAGAKMPPPKKQRAGDSDSSYSGSSSSYGRDDSRSGEAGYGERDRDDGTHDSSSDSYERR
jgi:hypothetical protein